MTRLDRLVFVTVSTLAVLVLFVASGCGDRESSDSQVPQADCVKKAGAPADGVPIYKKRGGGGEVRATVPGGTRVDIMRTKEGWSLVRLPATTTAGWIEDGQLEKCAGRTSTPAKAGPRRSKRRGKRGTKGWRPNANSKRPTAPPPARQEAPETPSTESPASAEAAPATPAPTTAPAEEATPAPAADAPDEETPTPAAE